jgi:hypothetical protein
MHDLTPAFTTFKKPAPFVCVLAWSCLNPARVGIIGLAF